MAAPISLRSIRILDLRNAGEPFTPHVAVVNDDALEDYREIWLPELGHRLAGLPLNRRSESDQWDWEQIAAFSAPYTALALWRTRRRELLALISLREDGDFDRGEWMDTAPCPELAPALYVEYLDTSPLVQRRLLRPDEARPYSSLLPALMKVCEKQSLRIGTQGRVLLHAIPGAVAAYERAGLSSIGVERFEGMDYQLMRNAIGWKA